MEETINKVIENQERGISIYETSNMLSSAKGNLFASSSDLMFAVNDMKNLKVSNKVKTYAGLYQE